MKKIKKPIIVLISILIVGVAVVLYLYFATDIFGSNNKDQIKTNLESPEETADRTLKEKAEEARINTLKEEAKEAVYIAKGDIISKYYADKIQFPDEKTIISKVKEFLDIDWQVEVAESNNGLYYLNFVAPKGIQIKNIELDLTEIYNLQK